MKITIVKHRRGGFTVNMDRPPLPESRFKAVCKLARAVIGGSVLLGAIALVGFWVIPWAVGALTLVGLYKLIMAGI